MSENRADAHLVNQAANCIARMATAHNVPPLQIIERLMSEGEGVVVELRQVRNERQAGSYTAYEFVVELEDGREALHVCEPGPYRLTRIEGEVEANGASGVGWGRAGGEMMKRLIRALFARTLARPLTKIRRGATELIRRAR